MKSVRLLFLVPLLFASCGVVHNWNEIETAPMSLADCYDSVEFIAVSPGRLRPDTGVCDRGLGIWQSRWRERTLGRFGKGRYRLKAEILIDEGSRTDGWTVRYVVEQQRVEDPRRRDEPTEDDWANDGQDREAEANFGERFRRRVGVKS